ESRLRYAQRRIGSAAVIDDERNAGGAKRIDDLAKLILFALDMNLPTPFPNLRKEARHRGMPHHVGAVGDEIEADTDHAAIVQFIERALIDIRRHAADAFEASV